MSQDKSIIVTQTSKSHPLQFQVTVSTHGSTTEHLVTIAQPHCDSLTRGRHFAVALVEASILFLLDREPKETMLRRFDISLINRYFPEFEEQLPNYLARVANADPVR
jgi:hypothetical protein